MTDKKYITGADVLRALADGKRVRRKTWEPKSFIFFSESNIRNQFGASFRVFEGLFEGDWEIVEEPATDEELATAMRIRAIDTSDTRPDVANAYRICADMLEQRKVKP